MTKNANNSGNIERHFWLTRSVARKMGLSLTREMADNRLSADDYALMVSNCCANGCHDACLRWLAAQTTGGNGPPEYCANKTILSRLKQPHKRERH